MIIDNGRVVGCGVLVVNALGEVLLGKRSDGQGWCLAGGKVEAEETPVESAQRELEEEFRVTANIHNLDLLGITKSSAIVRGEQRDVKCYIYKAVKYNLPDLFVPNDEMLDFKWMSIEEIDRREDIFVPTVESIKLYKNWLIKGAGYKC